MGYNIFTRQLYMYIQCILYIQDVYYTYKMYIIHLLSHYSIFLWITAPASVAVSHEEKKEKDVCVLMRFLKC